MASVYFHVKPSTKRLDRIWAKLSSVFKVTRGGPWLNELIKQIFALLVKMYHSIDEQFSDNGRARRFRNESLKNSNHFASKE
jgi:hypothetical protein